MFKGYNLINMQHNFGVVLLNEIRGKRVTTFTSEILITGYKLRPFSCSLYYIIAVITATKIRDT